MDLNKEPIITIVGFLGAGKTTLLKQLSKTYKDEGWNPFIILNDYENAALDAEQLQDKVDLKSIKALSGSCICCSGIHELRNYVNTIPQRKNGITLIEANGTSDTCSLMGFLGVGIDERFSPPVQISVVDAKNWQKRGEHNELELNQIQVSSLIILNHTDELTDERINEVKKDINKNNPHAEIKHFNELNLSHIATLKPSENEYEKLDHLKAHWSSCSVDLERLPNKESISILCNKIPNSIARVKGCTKIGNESSYTYFERTPDGAVYYRSFNGEPSTGAKLLSIGPGSNPEILKTVISETIMEFEQAKAG